MVPREEVVQGEEIRFFNYSRDAEIFEWDFDDGNSSDETSPRHTYHEPGDYYVTLTATGRKGHRSEYTKRIKVVRSTYLMVDVRSTEGEYRVAGARVTMYYSYDDWHNQTNKAAEALTDSEGIIEFNYLGPYTYFVRVESDDHSNADLGFYDVNAVRTPQLNPDVDTYFTAWVEPK